MSIFTIDKFCAEDISSRADYHESGEEHRTGLEDYYLQSGSDTALAEFAGRGAAQLGLGQTPQAGDYEALMSGINPRNGAVFCSKTRETQLYTDKKTVAGFSTSFNLDKSLSLIYATLPREQQIIFEKIAMEATRRAIRHLEKRGIFTYRTGAQGSISQPGEIVATNYLHFTNRNQEPHLHVHAEIPNLILGIDGKWRTLDARELYRRQVELAALFDSYLAQSLCRDLPDVAKYLETDPERSGLVVSGITHETVMNFSSRRREIQKALAEMGAEGAEAARGAAKRTRQAKAAVDALALRQDWKANLSGLSPTTGDLTPTTLLKVEAQLFKNSSVFRGHDLDRVAAQLSILHGGPDAINSIKVALHRQLSIIRLPSEVQGEPLYTTELFRQFELDLLSFARKSSSPQPRFFLTDQQIDMALSACEQERGFQLRDEQVQAMRHAADGRQLAIIQGAAGTGKSASLAALKLAYQAAGCRVLGLAPSGAAAAELQKSSGIDSRTIHSLLIRLENDSPQQRFSLTPNDVIIVDEAGMVDTRTLHKLSGFVEKARAKLVLVGDSKQLEAVGSASTLHMLTQQLGAGRLEQIARQRNQDDREISQAWFSNNGDPLGLMSARDLLRLADSGAPPVIDRLMTDAVSAHTAGTAWDQILLLADRNAQVRELNERVREWRLANGELTAAAEQVIQVSNDLRHSRPIKLSPGDRIMLRKNDKLNGTPVFNGDRATLTGIEQREIGSDDSGNSIYQTILQARLDRTESEISWSLDDYDTLDHSYAMTVHKSQGLTVERAFYLASESTDRRSAYVAFTRSKEACPFYLSLDSAAGFAERTSEFRAKTTALDADPMTKELAMATNLAQIQVSAISAKQPETKVLLEKAGDLFTYPGTIQSPPPPSPRIVLIGTGKSDQWLAESHGYKVLQLLDKPSDTRFRPGKPYQAPPGTRSMALQCSDLLLPALKEPCPPEFQSLKPEQQFEIFVKNLMQKNPSTGSPPASHHDSQPIQNLTSPTEPSTPTPSP